MHSRSRTSITRIRGFEFHSEATQGSASRLAVLRRSAAPWALGGSPAFAGLLRRDNRQEGASTLSQVMRPPCDQKMRRSMLNPIRKPPDPPIIVRSVLLNRLLVTIRPKTWRFVRRWIPKE
jgi:hypothetical protein